MALATGPPGARLEQFYTTDEVAKLFKRSRTWVREKFGKRNVMRIGHGMRIPESEIFEFMKECGYVPSGDGAAVFENRSGNTARA